MVLRVFSIVFGSWLCSVSIVYAQTKPIINWQVEMGKHPVNKDNSSVCKIESQNFTFSDEEKTQAHLVFVNQNLFVLTNANIDPSYSNTGLKIDWRKSIPFTKVVNKQAVVFENILSDKVKALTLGRSMTLTLGLWPTWPKEEANKIRISLRGFKKAYKKFEYCIEKSI